MKKTLLLGASLLCSVFIMATEIPFQKAEIKSIMRKVADWQIANPHPALEHDDLNWPKVLFMSAWGIGRNWLKKKTMMIHIISGLPV